MSIDAVVDVAYRAGFRGSALVTAVAIAGAESGYTERQVFTGNPGQTNPERSVGYWQINILAHPEYSEADMKDGLKNAHAAFQLSGGSDFSAWSTYGDDKYKSKMSEAQKAVDRHSGTTGSGSGLPDLGDKQQCVSVCLNNYPTENDATDATNASKRANCIASCNSVLPGGDEGDYAAQQTANEIIIPCSQCAWNNPVPCLSCAAVYLTKGLVTIGINLGFAALVLLGLYLLFRPEIHEQVSKAVSVAKEVGKAAATAAVL